MLTIAAVADDPTLVALALELGNRADLITSPYEGTALIAAAHLGVAKSSRLLAEGEALSTTSTIFGWTALMEAVVLGDGGPDHVATVQVLLAAGADPTIPTGTVWTARSRRSEGLRADRGFAPARSD